MDNLSSHKRQAIRTAIRDAGALMLFLPAYSPDLNPIDQVFAKIKALLRKADARGIEDIDAALGALLDQFQPSAIRTKRMCPLSQRGRLPADLRLTLLLLKNIIPIRSSPNTSRCYPVTEQSRPLCGVSRLMSPTFERASSLQPEAKP